MDTILWGILTNRHGLRTYSYTRFPTEQTTDFLVTNCRMCQDQGDE